MDATNTVEDNYMLSRGFGANLRVNLQYYLWKEGLGHVVHPSIPINKENLKVADIGSGTGIWLIDMSHLVPASAELHGFDVSHDQSPPVETLPPNVKLHIFDCLAPPTPAMIGQFDLVHLQNFNSIVKDNNPIPVINNMMAMLKPGGYLTWGEYDFQTWKVKETPKVGADYDNDLGKLLSYTATFGGTREPNFEIHNWTANLPHTFASCGMTNVEVERVPFSKDVTSFLLDTFVVAAHEVSVNVLDPLGGERGETCRKYIDAVGRNRRAIDVDLDRLTVIGQKPVEA